MIRCHKSNFLSVIGDQTYRVKLTVKDYKHPPEKGRGFYTHELTEIALPDVKRVVAHSEEPMPTPPPGNTITVQDLLAGASRNDGMKFFPEENQPTLSQKNSTESLRLFFSKSAWTNPSSPANLFWLISRLTPRPGFSDNYIFRSHLLTPPAEINPDS